MNVFSKKWKALLIVSFSLSVLLTCSACSSTRATYFRKNGATVEDERVAWGLCGGNFYENGIPKPVMTKGVLECMGSKGFQSVNSYYTETLVAWTRPDSNGVYTRHYDELKDCGARLFSKGWCKGNLFILKSEFNEINRCMSTKGYIAAIPRNRGGIRVYNMELDKVDSNFCLYLLPKNKKGGLSFGDWRLDY